MPRTKAKQVAQGGRTTKRPVIQKPAIQKPAIHKAVTEREITRKNIVAALQKAARKLGRTPSKREFAELSGRSKYQIIRYFQTYRAALAAAGMMPNQSGRRIEMAVLMADWGNVARKVGSVPSQAEYLRLGSYSIDCLSKRVQRWRNVSGEFCRFVAAGGLAGDWNDVLEKIKHGPIPSWNERRNLTKRREAARLAYEARTKGAPVIVEGLAPMEVTQHAADDTLQDKEIAVLNWPIPSPFSRQETCYRNDAGCVYSRASAFCAAMGYGCMFSASCAGGPSAAGRGNAVTGAGA